MLFLISEAASWLLSQVRAAMLSFSVSLVSHSKEHTFSSSISFKIVLLILIQQTASVCIILDNVFLLLWESKYVFLYMCDIWDGRLTPIASRS